MFERPPLTELQAHQRRWLLALEAQPLPYIKRVSNGGLADQLLTAAYLLLLGVGWLPATGFWFGYLLVSTWVSSVLVLVFTGVGVVAAASLSRGRWPALDSFSFVQVLIQSRVARWRREARVWLDVLTVLAFLRLDCPVTGLLLLGSLVAALIGNRWTWWYALEFVAALQPWETGVVEEETLCV